MSRLHGDVPKEYLELEKELKELEKYFSENKEKFSGAITAKAYVCMAHDWISMGDEEKGMDLIEAAHKICPTYFEKEIKEDMEKDHLFKTLVERLSSEIILLAANILSEMKDHANRSDV